MSGDVTCLSAAHPELQAAVASMAGRPWFRGPGPVLTAVSGGVDSMVLLYLLRFTAGMPRSRIHVGHLDHAARRGSEEDARWLRGLCRAWQVAFHGARLEEPMTTEAEGRRVRYRFLERLRARLQADVVLTAHTADDQAETVLFRIARGAGSGGLAGIHPARPARVERPLLPVWRSDIEAFARARRIPFREDPSNRDLRWTRNRLRHEVLPALEVAVPGARRALVRLADVATGETRCRSDLADALLRAWARHVPAGGLELGQEPLVSMGDEAVGAVLRRACERVGASPGAGATAVAVRFVRGIGAGGSVDMGGGVRIERSMGRIRISGPGVGAAPRADSPAAHSGEPPCSAVELGPGGGRSRCRFGEAVLELAWGDVVPGGFDYVAALPADGIRFPLVMRSRRPGDRIRMRGREWKVKKVLARHRVPSFARDEVPILADAEGTVLWVPGLTDPARVFGAGPHETPFYVAVRRAAGGTTS